MSIGYGAHARVRERCTNRSLYTYTSHAFTSFPVLQHMTLQYTPYTLTCVPPLYALYFHKCTLPYTPARVPFTVELLGCCDTYNICTALSSFIIAVEWLQVL